MSRLKSLNKLPSARAFSEVENGRLEVLELLALFLLKTETCDAKNCVFVDAIFCLVKIGFEKRGSNTK